MNMPTRAYSPTKGGSFVWRLKSYVAAATPSLPAQAGSSQGGGPSRGSPNGVPYRGCLHLDPKHGITGMRLSGHVRFDDLVGDVAATAAQGASRPHIATPKALPPLGKFGQQTLELWPCILDQATAGDVQRDGDHHVAMIRRDMSLQDIDPRFLTCFADKSADPFCTLTTQCFNSDTA